MLAPEGGNHVIACTSYLGYLYLERKEACHGASPDLILATYFLAHKERQKIATAMSTQPGLLYPSLQIPPHDPHATPFRALMSTPIELYVG